MTREKVAALFAARLDESGASRARYLRLVEKSRGRGAAIRNKSKQKIRLSEDSLG
jgi:hypothetical protein